MLVVRVPLRSAPAPLAAYRPVKMAPCLGGHLWRYMGEVLNLLEECAWQLGLSDYIMPPAPVTERTISSATIAIPKVARLLP